MYPMALAKQTYAPPKPLQRSHDWPSPQACVSAAATQMRLFCAVLRPPGSGRLSVHSTVGGRALCCSDALCSAAAGSPLVLQIQDLASDSFLEPLQFDVYCQSA